MTAVTPPLPPVRHRVGPALLIAAAVFALVLYLRLTGRVWWCGCGSWVPWSGAIGSRHNSQHLIDPYTPSHVLHGLIFFFATAFVFRKLSLAWRLCFAVLVEVAWESLENSPIIIQRYRAGTIALGYEGDSIANSLSDVASMTVGFFIARYVGWRWSIALFVAAELTTLYFIRDGLTLNVIMLVWPMEGLRRWQMG